MQDLSGRTAIVTGGTLGIGRAIAVALLERGAQVAVGSRTDAHVAEAVESLGRAAGDAARVHGVACDVRDADACARLMDETVRRFGGLDILVNNAGVGLFGTVADLSPAQWDQTLETNLSGAFYCAHFALPHLKRSGAAWIINIGSLAGRNAFPRGAAYNASKFGLIGFSEALMQEVRHDGVRVSLIMPGSVDTGFGTSAEGADWKIRPEDVARLVLELLDTPARTLPSRIEVRPSRPPKKS